MKHIVITGGPHAGKSTFLPYLVNQTQEQGYEVQVIPEFASELFEQGIHPSFGNINGLAFQKEIVKRYKDALGAIIKHSSSSQLRKTVVLSDRWIPDGMAYIDYSDYIQILRVNNLTPQKVMSDIHGILHLESTAVGLGLYDIFSNPARVGTTLEDAILLESKTKAAYESFLGKKITIINAHPQTGEPIDSKQKLDQALRAMTQLIK